MLLTCATPPRHTFGRSHLMSLLPGNAVPLLSLRRRLAPLLLAACLPIGAAPLQAQTDAQWLTERLDAWYRRSLRSAPGEWGIAVADQSGNMLWSTSPDLPLMPASTV